MNPVETGAEQVFHTLISIPEMDHFIFTRNDTWHLFLRFSHVVNDNRKLVVSLEFFVKGQVFKYPHEIKQIQKIDRRFSIKINVRNHILMGQFGEWIALMAHGAAIS